MPYPPSKKAHACALGPLIGTEPSLSQVNRRKGLRSTKIHALTHVVGRPYALMLAPDNVSDINAAPALLERAGRMLRSMSRDFKLTLQTCHTADMVKHSGQWTSTESMMLLWLGK